MIKNILIIGGGTAGWITAGLIAARYKQTPDSIKISLVESPDIGIIGVGEGTWPTMVNTLKKLGISETHFIQQCHASFKQASKFQRWVDGSDSDSYYHPFSLPQGFDEVNVVPQWQAKHSDKTFADAVSLQAQLCDEHKAPKLADFDEYTHVENHGYHLDAGKFTQLLTQHCVEKLGIEHLQADVIKVNARPDGDIASVTTEQLGDVSADLFIDCSGMAGLLIDKHYQVPFICKKDVLFIDRAIAVQVPYKDDMQPVASATISTAQTAGWIWDIGLSTRRGVGHVYSSKYIDKETAKQQLIDYIAKDVDDVNQLTFKELTINPGYREKFWVNNCVAVGMSSGFLEPLEASALVMIELAANTIAAHLPASREAMDVVAKQYNSIFTFRWEKIIDFLKLHYVLSKRTDSPFWIDNRASHTIPESLSDLLTLWKYQSPSNNGFLSPYDLFPAASYQYILYGMGFDTLPCHLDSGKAQADFAEQQLLKVQQRKHKVAAKLPTNRELLNDINACQREVEARGQHCAVVGWQQVSQASKHHPLFIRMSEEVPQVVALLGLESDEQLKPAQFETDVGSEITPDDLQHVIDESKQPVKLDITLNSGREVVVSDLYVLDSQKLPKEGVSQLAEAFVEQLSNSLEFVAELIDYKNRKESTP